MACFLCASPVQSKATAAKTAAQWWSPFILPAISSAFCPPDAIQSFDNCYSSLYQPLTPCLVCSGRGLLFNLCTRRQWVFVSQTELSRH